MQKMLSVLDLMEHLRVSRSKLYELIATGLKPSLYLGNSPRWTEEAVKAFLSEQPTSRRAISAKCNGGAI